MLVLFNRSTVLTQKCCGVLVFFFCVCWLKKKRTTFILQGSILLKYYTGMFFNLVFPLGSAQEEREKTFLRINCCRLDYEIG